MQTFLSYHRNESVSCEDFFLLTIHEATSLLDLEKPRRH